MLLNRCQCTLTEQSFETYKNRLQGDDLEVYYSQLNAKSYLTVGVRTVTAFSTSIIETRLRIEDTESICKRWFNDWRMWWSLRGMPVILLHEIYPTAILDAFATKISLDFLESRSWSWARSSTNTISWSVAVEHWPRLRSCACILAPSSIIMPDGKHLNSVCPGGSHAQLIDSV